MKRTKSHKIYIRPRPAGWLSAFLRNLFQYDQPENDQNVV